MKAIDLYAGVGGWALGLEMAGLRVTDSYEWWTPAIKTHEKNLRGVVHERDIRQLNLSELPNKIDVVVGSPPCTQFSFSNRGGKGDIDDGLVDIEKFLEVVSFVKPKFWAMENVPRVKEILDIEMSNGGRLARFADLGIKSIVVDMSEFGLPQRRRRCIAGNFDFSLLLSYRSKCKPRTLGTVLNALSKKRVVDPIFGETIGGFDLFDHEPEAPLNEEEERMNRESKMFHPVYNNMAFPDPETAPVRTITATCTRVSRESVVIRAPENHSTLRRLTVRERASLQGFPIRYQFFGASYAQKLKMIGNALPPLMSFYIAQAMRGVKAESLFTPAEGIKRFRPTNERPLKTAPDDEGRSYPPNRTFRAAIPNLRFKSGVRFEIANRFGEASRVAWCANFYFGNSKDIRECILDDDLLGRCKAEALDKEAWTSIAKSLSAFSAFMEHIDTQKLQDVWTHRASSTHPYQLVDVAGKTAEVIIAEIEKLWPPKIESFVISALGLSAKSVADTKASRGVSVLKVKRFSASILAGFIIGATLNRHLADTAGKQTTRRRELFVA